MDTPISYANWVHSQLAYEIGVGVCYHGSPNKRGMLTLGIFRSTHPPNCLPEVSKNFSKRRFVNDIPRGATEWGGVGVGLLGGDRIDLSHNCPLGSSGGLAEP